ncbi:MAG: CHAT domain-containing protein [Cyanomargarita calcarea GSE-NOS-MK-12-04C]|jgi:branched-chain amino acid transport system substrate-binding protein|uniref:CHAT domain-containing protein n=1 Tax=Cyanomargarita calcarea GSE-NOS-MK-12-04C TaxID=2839659 RepID=A0A951QNX7_9CYAN|nr:CHAT domain-containing protein [Cyanomargarita calcarea GSE-NOS-MK-12-04C]
MSKVVVFNIRKGNFEQGFPVTLLISEEGKTYYFEKEGYFPSAPTLPKLYRSFQENYKNLASVQKVINSKSQPRILKIDTAQTTNFSSTENCKEATRKLEVYLRQWFQQTDIVLLRQYVQEEIGKDELARIIFQTNNEILNKLPWHLWELFTNRRKAWLSLAAKRAQPSTPLKTPIKILAILGDDKGINLDIDISLLNNLRGAKIQPLKNPTPKQLCDSLRQEKPWDILYFAGHSYSQNDSNDGVIQINDIDTLSIAELRNAFRKAIENGLKLAIFNSCDGLGLANKMAELGIPQVIVMREPVPDEVAHDFLQVFLRSFFYR